MNPDLEHPIQLEVFYDGDCLLCSREISWLKKKNVDGLIRFTDIAAPGFDAAKFGKTWDELMAEMHGRLPDGTWVIGLDTFDHLYRVLRCGWMVRWTRWSWFRPAANLMYQVFARYRTKLPRRKTGSCRVDGNCGAHLK
ncbi:MAG: DUF393 domain-containing protein [Pirellulaceae bacterium]|nr:DUF393 domain-containing protein [Pirellulaceae bacterium]